MMRQSGDTTSYQNPLVQQICRGPLFDSTRKDFSREVLIFETTRRQEIQEQGHSVIMKKSLPKKMHDFIVQQLGFNTEFESMTVEQKRELFKAEAEMMINTRQQIKILEAIIQENERGNHNWFWPDIREFFTHIPKKESFQ